MKIPKNVWFIVDKRTGLVIAQASSVADAARGIREARRRGITADARKVPNPPKQEKKAKVKDQRERQQRELDDFYAPYRVRKMGPGGFRTSLQYRGPRFKKNPDNRYAVIDYGEVVPSLGFRFSVQCLPDRPLQVPPGVQILVMGMTRQGARALADHLNDQVKRGRHVPRQPIVRLPRGNPAFLRGRRGGAFFQVRRSNPTLAVMGANPPRAAGDDIEATWATISYRRPDDPEGRRVVREHEFNDGFVATPMHDGSILLRHPRGYNLWTRR